MLKYFIDMLKFPGSFDRKPVCFVGVADGVWGALRPVEQLQQVFGYRHSVMFPIRVTPSEKDKPAILALSLDYSVCEKLCLPVHFTSRLVLPPQAGAAIGSAGGTASQ